MQNVLKKLPNKCKPTPLDIKKNPVRVDMPLKSIN